MYLDSSVPAVDDPAKIVNGKAWLMQFLRERMDQGFTGQIKIEIEDGQIVRVMEERVIFELTPGLDPVAG